jgi:hypothetical protein
MFPLTNICSIDVLPDDQEDVSSWDTWYFHQDITYECTRVFYATADTDEEDVILHEKGTVESEYDNDFDDGEDYGNRHGMGMGRIRATGMV